MNQSQTTLQVGQESGLQPYRQEDGSQNLQQTRGGEDLGFHTDQAAASQADQNTALEFLRSESAGPSYDIAQAPKNNITMGQAGLILAASIVLTLLLMNYFRFFSRRLADVR